MGVAGGTSGPKRLQPVEGSAPVAVAPSPNSWRKLVCWSVKQFSETSLRSLSGFSRLQNAQSMGRSGRGPDGSTTSAE
jgi:hypothetical protein